MIGAVIWSAIGRLGGAISTFASNVIIFRLLSPSEAGEFYLALSVVSIFSVVSCCGFNRLNVIYGQLYTNKPAEFLAYLSSSFSSILAMVLLVVVSVVSVSYFSDIFSSGNRFLNPYLVAGLICVVTLQIYLAELFRGLSMIKSATLVGNYGAMGGIGYGLVSSLIGLLLLTSIFVADVAIELNDILCISIGINFVALVFILFRTVSFDLMKKLMYSKVVPSIILLKKAAPMLLVSLGMMFVTQLELWLVMLFSDLESVGSYSVVMRLIVVQNLPVIILTSAVQSSIVRCMANKDYLKLNSMISAIFVLVSFCMTLVCAFYWCWSVEIISLIFGDEYPLASELLPLRSISLFVSSLAGFVVLTLMLGQNPWQAMIASIIVIVINIALVPLLSPVLGAKSVVVAVLISSSISLFYVLTVYKAKYKLLPIIDGGLRGVVAGFKQFLEVKYV